MYVKQYQLANHILPTNFCIDRNDLIKMMTMNSKKSYVMFSSMATTRTTSTEKCVSISNKWLEALKMGLSHDQWTQWAILKRKNPNSQFSLMTSMTTDWLIEFLIPNSFSMIFPVFFGSILLAHCAAGGGWSSYSVRSSTRGGRTKNRTGSWEAKLALNGRHGAPFLLASSISSQFVRLFRKVNKWNSLICQKNIEITSI